MPVIRGSAKNLHCLRPLSKGVPPPPRYGGVGFTALYKKFPPWGVVFVGVIGGSGFRGGPPRWDGRVPQNRQANPAVRHGPDTASWRFNIASFLLPYYWP